jgi:hypothetical protein
LCSSRCSPRCPLCSSHQAMYCMLGW